MEIVIVLIVVGLVAVGVMAVVGTKRPGGARAEDTPDHTELTDTDTVPPARPEEPVPGSRTHRARARGGLPEDGSEVVRRRSR